MANAGMSAEQMMATSGHKSIKVVQGYIDNSEPIKIMAASSLSVSKSTISSLSGSKVAERSTKLPRIHREASVDFVEDSNTISISGNKRPANEIFEVSAPQKRTENVPALFNIHFHGAISGGHINFAQHSMLAQSENLGLANKNASETR